MLRKVLSSLFTAKHIEACCGKEISFNVQNLVELKKYSARNELNIVLVALPSRTNEFKHLPQFPLVEKDLSILVNESVTVPSI